MIAVMGASGNTGKKIAEGLLKAGESVRALGRSETKLAELKAAGAEVQTGDAADTTFLTRAFSGAAGVYTLLPTDPTSPDYDAEQDRQGHAVTSAIRESRVKYVVALSSVGAELDAGTGLLVGLHAQEERLRQLPDTNVMLLRPVSFFENFYNMLPVIKAAGIIPDSYAADLLVPMVATKDIAEVATVALKNRDWRGLVVRELLGPRDLSCKEATRIIGESIGKPDLMYVETPYADEAKALVESGLSQSFANLYVEMIRAINEGRVKPSNGRNAANTTSTRFEDFASELAHSYRSFSLESRSAHK